MGNGQGRRLRLLIEVRVRCDRPEATYPNVICSPHFAKKLDNMPFKTFFYGLKNAKVPRVLGDVPSKLLNWRGRVLSAPHPAFDAKAIAHERWRVGTSGVSLSKPLRWLKPGASPPILFGVWRNYALSNPQPLKFMFILGFWSLCFEK